MKPRTRRSGLLLRELPEELLVYDQERHTAHCLNRTAALVFRHADGTRTPAQLSALPGADAEVVSLALRQLEDAGLLEPGVSAAVPEAAQGMSRREVARRVGIAAAILLPAVATIVAPTPAEAAATCVTSCSSQPNGTPCTCLGENPCFRTCISGLCDGTGPC
jgi:hypothetical protein